MTTGARTALLHEAHQWPNEMHASLCPAAIKNYANLRNSIPAIFKPETYHGRNKIPLTYDSSPIAQLSAYKVELNLEHFHPFVSPVYVIKTSL